MAYKYMLKETELQDLLIFDLETAPGHCSFDDLAKHDPRKAELWKIKHDKAGYEMSYEDSYMEYTALSPEFGRIVCASFCYVTYDDVNELFNFNTKSFYDDCASSTSEKDLILLPISRFFNGLVKNGKEYKLCGHNIKNFDIPFLSKRLIASDIRLPYMLNSWGKKPWEITHVDTGEIWSMGVWNQYVSLDLLSCSLGIKSPKENMKGEYVGKSFWIDKDYKKIADYCIEDVKCVLRICHKFSMSKKPLSCD